MERARTAAAAAIRAADGAELVGKNGAADIHGAEVMRVEQLKVLRWSGQFKNLAGMAKQLSTDRTGRSYDQGMVIAACEHYRCLLGAHEDCEEIEAAARLLDRNDGVATEREFSARADVLSAAALHLVWRASIEDRQSVGNQLMRADELLDEALRWLSEMERHEFGSVCPNG